MKAKWILTAVGTALVAGVCLHCVATDKPTTQQAANTQLNAAQGARGKGRLVALKVPQATVFKTKDGRSGWKVKIPGGRPLATPAVADGILFVGGGFGSYEFYALDAATGNRRWTFKCGDDGPTAAVVADGCVAYNTESCTIYIHDLKTGKVLWHKWLGDPLMSQPAIGAGKVFMAYPGKGGHHLAAFELRTGKVAWDKQIAAEIITAPVVAGDCIVAATVDGTLYKFDLATGKKHWSVKCKATSAPRVLGKQILISQRSEKKIRIKDDKGKETTSEITVEGLNIVSLDDGKVAHAEPLSPVKAAFLLTLAAQGMSSDNNNAFSMIGQTAYRRNFATGQGVLQNVKGNRADQAAELNKRIEKFRKRKVADKPGEGQKDAKEALELAKAIEKFADTAPANDSEKKTNEQLKKLAQDIRSKAEVTSEAAGAAKQAQKTIVASRKELKKNQVQNASVGFASSPAAAKTELAAGNIGQGNVKAIWAYQGSRPCLFEGASIMVHGPKIRSVDIKTGKVKWEHRFDFKVSATRPVTPPALAGGKLYVGTADGRIVCFDAAKGKRLWQAEVGGRILFELAVVKSCVYAATDNGMLICLKTADPTADGWNMWGGSAKHNGQEK